MSEEAGEDRGKDEVQRHRPGGGCIQPRALDIANESPRRAGLLVEGVAEGAAQLDVMLSFSPRGAAKAVMRRLPEREARPQPTERGHRVAAQGFLRTLDLALSVRAAVLKSLAKQ